MQFSKSHHTETLTFLDSPSWRLGEVLEEVEKWATKILRGDEGEDEEEEEKRERRDFGEKGFIVNQVFRGLRGNARTVWLHFMVGVRKFPRIRREKGLGTVKEMEGKNPKP